MCQNSAPNRILNTEIWWWWWRGGVAGYLSDSVKHGSVFLGAFAEGGAWGSWPEQNHVCLLTKQGNETPRLGFLSPWGNYVCIPWPWWRKIIREKTAFLYIFFLFQFCSLVFVIPFSSLENATASHLVSFSPPFPFGNSIFLCFQWHQN